MSTHHDDHDSTQIPNTLPMGGLGVIVNGALIIAIFAIAMMLLSPWAETPIPAGLITLLAIGGLIAGGVIAGDMADYTGGMLFDPITKKRRAIFPGFFWKKFYESMDPKMTDLKREISSGDPKEPLQAMPTNDPAENMEVLVLIHHRFDAGHNANEASKNLQKIRSIEEHALKDLLRAETVKMFASYYGENELEVLMDRNKVQTDVMAIPENADKMKDLAQRYGIHIGVVLEKSHPDAATRALKTTPARAEALRTSMDTLMKNGGMDIDKARSAALLIDENADFTEQENKWTLNINAPDLKNLRDVSIIPPGMLGGDKGKKAEKKGGNK